MASPPRFKNSIDQKMDAREGSMRNDTNEETMTVKKHNGVDSAHSRNSSRYADDSRFPALPNKITMLSDDQQASPRNVQALGYSGIGGDSVMFLHGKEDKVEEDKRQLVRDRKKSGSLAGNDSSVTGLNVRQQSSTRRIATMHGSPATKKSQKSPK